MCLPPWLGEIFRFTLFKLLKRTCETFPPSLHDLIIRPHVKQSPHKFAKKFFSPKKSFFERKKVSFTFGGRRHYALSSYALGSFLTSMVQAMAFQSKTT